MTSRRIVLSTYGSLGDLHPYLALALELKRRGHRPVLATSALYRAKIEAEGLEFAPLRPDLPDPQIERELARTLIRRVMDERDGTRYLFEELLMPSLRDSYDDLLRVVQGADLLVTHMLPLSGPLVAQVSGIKWASAVLAPVAFFSAHELCVPPDQANQKLFNAARHLPPKLLKPFIEQGKRGTLSWTQDVAKLRRDLKLPPGENPIFEGQHSPKLVLALFSRALADVQPDWPISTRATGFCFYDKKDGAPMPRELLEFLDAGEAPIVFTLGSSAVLDAGEFFRESAAAARILKRRAVLLTGDEATAPRDLPAEVAAFEYAPFGELFPRAAAVVHQGGVGTTGQSMRAGVPTLIMPFTHDQPDHAARLERLGMGRQISRRRYTAAQAARELSQLLNVASYAKNARAIGERVRREDGPSTACDALEAMF